MAQVVIAVRGGPEAKSRCAGTLSAEDRGALTAAMLEDMLGAVARCPNVGGVWVVTPTPRLAAIAARGGARVVHQNEPANLNAAFATALAEIADGSSRDPVMLMPGDLPLLKPDDLSAAIILARTHAVVLAPSPDGGTGLLGQRPGVLMPPEFGAGSFHRHAASAVHHGYSLAIIAANSLGQDVDRPEDLEFVLEQGPATRAAAVLRQCLHQRIMP